MTLPPTDVRLQFVTDRDLLRRFLQDADEAAFGEIVRRHQSLVLAVCRRVVGDCADMDDAFQATFIALARRPKSIRKCTSLSSWLYTVAWRTSWRLVRQRRKNPVEPLPQQPAAESTDPLDRIASAQDCTVLDEELNDLPGKYRDVLVMTYFTQQSSQQIADELGVSKGTIDGRIRQARNMLRVRLARRGVAIGVLAAAAGLSVGPAAAATPTLLESTLTLGAQTLSSSLPGTTDLSHLEPLIRPETAMMTTKLVVSGLFCATAIIGVVGMNGVADDGKGDGTESAFNAEVSIDQLPTRDAPDSEEFGASGKEQNANVAPNAVAFEVPDSSNNAVVTWNVGAGAKGGQPRYADYPADAAPVEKWLHECLDKPIGNLDFPGDTPLSEVLAMVAEYYTTKHGADNNGDQHMTIYPDRGELSLNNIESMEDVIVSDISFSGMTLRNALKHIFSQTIDDTKSPTPLTYVIQDEVLMVTTLDKATSEEMMFTRVYDVTGLVDLDYGNEQFSGGGFGGGFHSLPMAQIGDGSLGGMGGLSQQPDVSVPRDLSDLVMEMTSPPCQWMTTDGQGGAIRLVGQNLVVRQTHNGHREVVRLLNLLSESISKQN